MGLKKNTAIPGDFDSLFFFSFFFLNWSAWPDLFFLDPDRRVQMKLFSFMPNSWVVNSFFCFFFFQPYVFVEKICAICDGTGKKFIETITGDRFLDCRACNGTGFSKPKEVSIFKSKIFYQIIRKKLNIHFVPFNNKFSMHFPLIMGIPNAIWGTQYHLYRYQR